MPEQSWTAPAVDPANLRSMLMLDVARELMLDERWPQKNVTVSTVDREDERPGAPVTTLVGVNDPAAIAEVAAGRVAVSVLNPVVALNMARLGTGPFDAPLPVSTIAVMPHFDQLAFAVSDRLGFTSLADVAAAQYPLRVSVRGSADEVTRMSVDAVLGTYGFGLADLVAWGGSVSYDQPMPPAPSRLGRLRDGGLDAIFEEGTIIWADRVKGAGAHVLPIDDEHLAALQRLGFRRGVLEEETYPSLEQDVQTADYSGWPVYCSADAPEELVAAFCRGLSAAKDRIVWQIGPAQQPPLPLARMVRESPSTPFDVPLHPAAAAYWTGQGLLP